MLALGILAGALKYIDGQIIALLTAAAGLVGAVLWFALIRGRAKRPRELSRQGADKIDI